MKKVFALIMVLVMLLSFAACGDSGKKEEKTSFDAKKAAEALLGSDEFKGCALEDPGQIEFEFDITLEDTKEFYMTRANGLSANMFIIAVAKDGKDSLMFGEMEKIVKTYAASWVDSTYPERQAEAPKVKDRYESEKDGVYVCIISADNDAMVKLIGK
jgi:hypothetical protein